ncbi:MAG: hypothetical protein EOO73_29230 [Myxococcales bacterium]|nr:MAG: hypothetical protein EOO73_29230 [Myxococcales bacterium]
MNDDGTISQLPCRGPADTFTSQGAPLAPERVVVWERPERVLGFGSLLVAQTESARVPVSASRRALVRPGFVATLFRPPRG